MTKSKLSIDVKKMLKKLKIPQDKDIQISTKNTCIKFNPKNYSNSSLNKRN